MKSHKNLIFILVFLLMTSFSCNVLLVRNFERTRRHYVSDVYIRLSNIHACLNQIEIALENNDLSATELYFFHLQNENERFKQTLTAFSRHHNYKYIEPVPLWDRGFQVNLRQNFEHSRFDFLDSEITLIYNIIKELSENQEIIYLNEFTIEVNPNYAIRTSEIFTIIRQLALNLEMLHEL